jgi:hypothetical protein
MKDGSRSTAYAMHIEYANHLKALCSKDKVLSVQAKGPARKGQVSVMKLNELNRYAKCRKELDVDKTIGFFTPMG